MNNTMNNAWDHAQTLANKHAAAANGLFIKLTNDGDKVIGAFVGDPYAREVHWSGERYVSCMGDGCSFCEGNKKPTLRISMNFYVAAEKSLKVIEGGIVWFKDLLKVKEKYGLDKWLFEIERHGEAGNSKTTYTILPEEKPSSALTTEIEALDLHDLAQTVSGNGNSSNSSDQPIDVRVASEFVGRLKTLPREAVDVFLGRFGVTRIRDLKASDENAACTLVESLETKYSQAQPIPGEIDPFA